MVLFCINVFWLFFFIKLTIIEVKCFHLTYCTTVRTKLLEKIQVVYIVVVKSTQTKKFKDSVPKLLSLHCCLLKTSLFAVKFFILFLIKKNLEIICLHIVLNLTSTE